jgi:hypothetical protein
MIKVLFCILCQILITVSVFSWNEEPTGNLGNVVTVHSRGDEHSTYHYDLIKVLCLKAGFSKDTAEIITRFSALVDQINPKANYPYKSALNNISISDTFPDWNESIAGTERGSTTKNQLYNETPAIYWHFPFRNPNDTITGPMMNGDYPKAADVSYRKYPYYWRVPFNDYMSNIKDWALYSKGGPGMPDKNSPDTIKYFNSVTQQYVPIPQGSLAALGIFLHILADSYSHENCAVNDTLRTHPPNSQGCGLDYHTVYEYAYTDSIYACRQAECGVQASWRVLMEYRRVHNLTNPVIWTKDNNGFQDGDGIPDELEDDGDADHSESFIEKWKSPSQYDLNYDDVIGQADHSSWRIRVCNLEIYDHAKIILNSGWNMISTPVISDVGSNISNYCYDIKSNLIIVKNDFNSAYIPEYNINNIGNLDPAKGYLIYLKNKDTIEVYGNYVNTGNLNYNLSSGWNMISYPKNQSSKIIKSFKSLTDSGNLVMVKDNQGNVYIPEYNIDNIIDLIPGNGYQIYLREAVNFVYSE